MIQVSIVIRCYNEEKFIGRLLTGIMEQTIQNLDIILVDSGSTDATLAVASRYPVRILSIQPGEFSFGRSLNAGCSAARGEFIVIASGHVYPVYKDWLENLLSPFEDPRVALVYGKQRGAGKTQYSEHQVFSKWFPDRSNPEQDHPFCNNANAAIRRKMWEEMPYDEELTGLEDIDWASRAMRSGHKIVYRADAPVFHVHRETPLQTYNRYRREAIALKKIFPNEQFHFGDFVRLFLTNVLSDYGQALRDGVLAQDFFGIPRFRLMQFWGTYRGVAQWGPVTSQLKQTFYYPHRQRQQVRRPPRTKEEALRIDYETADRLYHEDR